MIVRDCFLNEWQAVEPIWFLVVMDRDLDSVFDHLKALDPDGNRFAAAIRRTFDMLLDGQNTGRYRWAQLFKTEKTHCGTLIEINLQREFQFASGDVLDYEIRGAEVDCKYSQRLGGWQIPPEAVGQLVLAIWAEDQAGRWSAGLVRASDEYLNPGRNRDLKATLSRRGREGIRWLFKDSLLPENLLLRLSDEDINAIWQHAHGQKRVNELFRRTLGRRVRREVVATVAVQVDYMKRVRYDGGSRSLLRAEGIVIFGDYASHMRAAAALGIDPPRSGEFVSERLALRASRHCDRPYVVFDGEEWVVADSGDPVVRAPVLPSTRK